MYHFALRLYEDGEYQLSVKQLEQLISQYPSGELLSDAIFLMGCSHDNLGNYEAAVDYLQRYVADFSAGDRYCEAMVLLGTNQRRMGHYTIAEQTFRSLLDGERCKKQHEEASAKLAELLFVQERFKEALTYYRRLFPKGYEKQHGLTLFQHYAHALLATSELKEAQEAFGTLEKKAKDGETQAYSLFHLGVVSYLSGDFEKSQQQFTSLLEKFPRAAQATDATLGIVWSVYKQKDHERAASLLGQRQAKKEASFEAADRAIDALEAGALGELDRGISILKDLLEGDLELTRENRRDISMQVAEWQEAAGEPLAAIGTLQALLSEDIGSETRYEVRFRLAGYMLGARRVADAETLLQEIAEEDPFGPHIAECLLLLARASRVRMDFEEAIKRYRSVALSFKDAPVSAEATVECAEMLLDNSRAMDAIPLLNSMLNEGSLEPAIKERAQFSLCRCFYAIKAFENCEASLEQFLKDYPKTSLLYQALVLRGQALRAIGSEKESLKALQEAEAALTSRPPAEGMVLGLLLVRRSMDQLQRCASYLSDVRGSFNWSPEFSRILDFWGCFISRERGDQRDAGKCFQNLAQGSADTDFASLCYAEAARSGFDAKKFDDAAEYLSEMVAADLSWPYSAVADENLRKALVMEGKYEASLDAVSEFREHEPGAFLAMDRAYNQAKADFDEGKFRAAARVLKRQIKSYPGSSSLHKSRLLLARVRMAQNKLGAAEDVLSPVLADELAESREKQLASALMGDTWYRRGKSRQAVEHYSKLHHPVLDDRAEEAQLLYRIGNAYRTLDNADRALAYYKRLVTGYEDLKGLCAEFVAVGDNLRKMREFELARKALGIVISDEGCSARFLVEAQFWFAYTLQQEGSFDNAILKYLDLVYTFTEEDAVPWVASARANVGECYEAKGDLDEALRAYQKIVSRYPGTRWSEQAEARIARIREMRMSEQGGAKSP